LTTPGRSRCLIQKYFDRSDIKFEGWVDYIYLGLDEEILNRNPFRIEVVFSREI